MPSDTPVNKRVKRHVIGREHRFFVAAAPALAGLCEQETKDILGPDHQLQSQPGGMEFSGRLSDAHRLNLLSRFSNRILMHLTAFKATNFRKLEQKLAAIAWDLYLYRDSPLKVRVNVHKCRLYHTKAVVEIVLKQVRRHLEQFGLPPAPDQKFDQYQQLFIRGKDDTFSVAIDSSGDHLYKRGLKTHGGRAPLRENLAAAVLALADYNGREPLLDPMCGSGTFSLEAALQAAAIPPGWFRNYAFMQWPSYIHRRWQYLLDQQKKVRNAPVGHLILAADTDSEACDNLRQCIQSNGLADLVQVAEQDFFKLQPSHWTDQKGLIVLNPPYGRRLEIDSVKKSLTPIIDRLQTTYSGWRLALIAPRKLLASIKAIPLKTYPLIHGGLRVAAGVGKIP